MAALLFTKQLTMGADTLIPIIRKALTVLIQMVILGAMIAILVITGIQTANIARGTAHTAFAIKKPEHLSMAGMKGNQRVID